jgi:MSHA biogenesis protein MshP
MKRQRGFGAIAAIVILVILAVLGAAIVSIGTTQQMTSAQDVLSARAWQAARAGNEWGLYKALRGQDWAGAGTCDTATRTATVDLSADTGFHVTITCDSWPYNEGESVPGTAQVVRVFRIKAVACPAATCPMTSSSVAGAGYVERTRIVLATN